MSAATELVAVEIDGDWQVHTLTGLPVVWGCNLTEEGARLFAAAPAMLATLEECRDVLLMHRSHYPSGKARKRADAAIAAAKRSS